MRFHMGKYESATLRNGYRFRRSGCRSCVSNYIHHYKYSLSFRFFFWRRTKPATILVYLPISFFQHLSFLNQPSVCDSQMQNADAVYTGNNKFCIETRRMICLFKLHKNYSSNIISSSTFRALRRRLIWHHASDHERKSYPRLHMEKTVI